MKTNIKTDIYLVEDTATNLVAYARITIDEWLVIRNLRIVQNKNGLFVSMPSQKEKGERAGYRDVVYPINNEARMELTDLVLNAYYKANNQ